MEHHHHHDDQQPADIGAQSTIQEEDEHENGSGASAAGKTASGSANAEMASFKIPTAAVSRLALVVYLASNNVRSL